MEIISERIFIMKLIDLHIHSTASDGSLTPTEVVNRANDLGLTAMALTDHDTVAGIDEALEAAKDLNMEVIPGIEVSCIYKGKEIHILGLYIDHKDPKLLSFLKEASRKRYDRNMEMLAAFNKDGFEITEEDLLCGNPGTVITRAHFARALLKNGYVTSVDQAFKKYLNPDRPYYRSRELITPPIRSSISSAGPARRNSSPCSLTMVSAVSSVSTLPITRMRAESSANSQKNTPSPSLAALTFTVPQNPISRSVPAAVGFGFRRFTWMISNFLCSWLEWAEAKQLLFSIFAVPPQRSSPPAYDLPRRKLFRQPYRRLSRFPENKNHIDPGLTHCLPGSFFCGSHRLSFHLPPGLLLQEQI